jgi:hypothetical protein
VVPGAGSRTGVDGGHGTFNLDERVADALSEEGIMTAQLMEYFNRQPRLGSISTAGRDGKVDVAVMGSPRMTDEKTVIVGLGANRTLANLRENPNAVYMIVEPGAGIMDWKGVRVYMTLRDLATAGPALDAYLAEMVKVAGEGVASMIKALATFEVTEVRPILDMGQGWEQSV